MEQAVFGARGFKARSGRVVKPQEDGSIRFGLGLGYLGRHEAMDAEEFFQAKRDEELGRWRCPVEPDHVVYESNGQLRVMRESDGHSNVMSRKWFEEHRMSIFAAEERTFFRVLGIYVEAHPERKPWHDAKVGEVWILTHVKGETGAFIVDRDRFESPSWSLTLNAESITDGHRIWSEVES